MLDYLYFLCYVAVFVLCVSTWTFAAIVAFCISSYFGYEPMAFIISSLCFTVFCLHKDNHVALSGLAIVVFHYVMAWENAISDSYFLSDNVYMTIVTVLNFALMISLIKSEKNGIYNTAFFRLHDNKLSTTHHQKNKA